MNVNRILLTNFSLRDESKFWRFYVAFTSDEACLLWPDSMYMYATCTRGTPPKTFFKWLLVDEPHGHWGYKNIVGDAMKIFCVKKSFFWMLTLIYLDILGYFANTCNLLLIATFCYATILNEMAGSLEWLQGLISLEMVIVSKRLKYWSWFI